MKKQYFHLLREAAIIQTKNGEKKIIQEEEGTPKIGRHRDVPDDQFDSNELAMGIDVEKEHTDSPEIAKEISKDHLAEIPDYYTRLKKMEEEGKAAKGGQEVTECNKPLGESEVEDMDECNKPGLK